MRILHICQRDDPDTGGALRVAEGLVAEQRKAGHDAWMLFLYGPPAEIGARFAPHTRYLGVVSSRHALRGIIALRRALRELQPDIINSHDGIIWPRLMLLFSRIPVVMHSHLPAEKRAQIKQKLGLALIKRSTDLLIGISRHTSQTWLDKGFPLSRLEYIPNGVDFERFNLPSDAERAACRRRLGLPRDKKLILWVGRLHQSMKGSDRAEHLARMLPEDTLLVVVGHGPDYAGMLERCSDLIGNGRLIMAGTTSRPEEYYKTANGYLFTSYHEPFGLVILEAVASGLPILSLPVTGGGGAVELLREFNAVEIEDRASRRRVAEVLDVVFHHAESGAALRERAKRKYSWEMISQQVVSAYGRLLNPPASLKPPRILHVCQRDDLSTGGATRIAFDLVRGQRAEGVDAHLVFLYGKPRSLGWELLPDKCTHYLKLVTSIESIWKGRAFAKLIASLRPDVIHHHDMLLWPQITHLQAHRYRLVYHAHLDYSPPRRIRAHAACWLMRRNTDVFITPSEYGKALLLAPETEVPGERVTIIPNGTRIPACREKRRRDGWLCTLHGFSPEQSILGWGGRLHCATKGTDDFIRLIARLPGCHVGVIAGQGPDEGMLRKLTAELGVEDRVFFHGLEQDMERFYRGIDVSVITSRFESFGLVVIEALAQHVPVVAFRAAGGIRDLFSLPGVHVVEDRSIGAMAGMIQQTLDHPARVAEALEQGFLQVETNYSLRRMVQDTLKLYAVMLPGTPT